MTTRNGPTESPLHSQSAPSHPITSSTILKFLRAHAVEVCLCLCLWFVYGMTANSRNQYEFNLQQAGVEAMVERHHFYLEGSPTPRFQMQVYYYDGGKPFGDVFMQNGHQYAAKQPGQFMLGAIGYFFLHLMGLDYVNHYTVTSVLVSFLTTSLVTAFAGVAVFAAMREFMTDERIFWPLAGALLYGLGTTAFVYSGIAYHDALASGYLAIAFYCAVLLARRRLQGQWAKLLAGVCGVSLGVTVTTSMLPFFMACVIGLYVVSLRRGELVLLLLLGGIIGITPLFLYNAVSFGNPLINSYIAGGYPESMLHFDLHNTLAKIQLYLSEITLYAPIVWLGALGLILFPRSIRREQLVMLLLLAAQAFQVLNIESHGGCHYGPRFLLPAMPFACIGLAGFSLLPAAAARSLAKPVAIIVGLFSIFVSALGATYTGMYCDVGRFGLLPALQNLKTLHLNDFPLAPWLALPLLFSVFLLIHSIRNYHGLALERG